MPANNISQPESINNTVRIDSSINDLIGNPPNWLLRSGISMVAFVAIIILTGTYFISYPDKLVSKGVLTAESPPIEILCMSNGYIEKIHIQDGSNVNKGDILMYINNTTDQDNIDQLISWLEEYDEIGDPKQYLKLNFPEDLQLGSIQGEYASLGLQFNELCRTLKDGVVFQQINNLSREIEKIGVLNQSKEREKEIYSKELQLVKKDHARQEELLEGGVISELDYEAAKTFMLQKERQYEGMNNSIIQNNIRIEQLSLEKLRLQEERSNKIKLFQFTIAGIKANIKTAISQWTYSYVVRAPIEGKITYASHITEKRPVQQGELLSYIIPFANDNKYVSAKLPVTNMGKLETGQKALLKFDAYPYKEFGVVISTVKSIGDIPEANADGDIFYDVKIAVEDTIMTDYTKEIPYKPNMIAQVEIITEDRSIFERIFDQFLRLTKDI